LGSHLIAFFGADGTGKTTHADFLSNYLKSKNIKIKKVWIRSPHTLAYIISVLFVKVGFFRIVSNPYGKRRKFPKVDINWPLRFFWSQLEFVSVIPLIIVKIRLPLLLGYTIVAERYVIDTIVTVAYYISDMNFLQSFTAKILLLFIPKEAVLIHLDSDYATLLRRRGSSVEARNFIEFQRKGYKIVDNLIKSNFIDTSKNSVEDTFNKIIDQLAIQRLV